MISFHPTISPFALLRYMWQTKNPPDLTSHFSKLFPEHHTELTDSGRSALALVIEALNLQGKTILLPAYVCDAFYPVFLEYDINPIFLDVEEATYQPSLNSYTDGRLDKVDAIILVATYGKVPNKEITNYLKERGKIIIEDYAMCSPLLGDSLSSHARIYSLPKTLPVPDGGLAILPKNSTVEITQKHHFSIGFIKNVLKLLPGMAPFIARVRNSLRREQTSPSWSGVQSASTLTKTILCDYCTSEFTPAYTSQYPYCHPMQTTNPEDSIKKLMSNGISAEQIWNRPIVINPSVSAHYKLDSSEFPGTRKLATQIVCAPLWHLNNDKDYQNYIASLHRSCEN